MTYQYPGGLQGTGTLLFVPVRPSFCRTFFSFKPEGFSTAAAAGDGRVHCYTQLGAALPDCSLQRICSPLFVGGFWRSKLTIMQTCVPRPSAPGASAGGVKGWAMGVAKGLVRQAAKVPHWLYLWQKLTDQDVVAMYSAVRRLRLLPRFARHLTVHGPVLCTPQPLHLRVD